MRKYVFSRLLVGVCAIAMVVQMPGMPSVKADDDDNEGQQRAKPTISISPVIVFGGGPVITPAGSQLARERDGVFISLHTQNLTPGTVVSAWWIIFNQPRRCATSPCTPADLANPEVQASALYGAGRLVGADGAVNVGAYRAVGDTTGVRSGPGLLDSKRAEIHLVIRSHGPALMGDLLTEQLTMHDGGCMPSTNPSPNMCRNAQVTIHQP